jgi:hypothetical protein
MSAGRRDKLGCGATILGFVIGAGIVSVSRAQGLSEEVRFDAFILGAIVMIVFIVLGFGVIRNRS